ncbi:hypothetical protein EX30DRAFT_356743 [Ascodesmis nigricans]|uniref:USP domain-containing protein n=1 Tax=Ascodesmis nigricans TaxID=341454 RepID=A0A4S2N586_9PEZI|nr:hypothetical protein EX30DRAFT_356743 [Ascodesmis nigricans]
MAYTSRGTSEVLVGGAQRQMFTINLEKGTVVSEIPTDEEVKIIKRSTRHLVCGMANGNARLLDMNTFDVVKEFPAVHNGTVLDMDTHDNLMISCGYVIRQVPVANGAYLTDPLVKIYDLRMMKALPPHSFPGATFIRMHPKMTASAIIASSAGAFQTADIMNPSAIQVYHANTHTFLTALDLSPTGDVLAMMDADGHLQLWSRSGKTNFTDLAAQVDWPDPYMPKNTGMFDADYTTPFNKIGMPYYREELLSAWPTHLIFDVPKLPQRIDTDTLAKAAQAGYAPYNRRWPRNFVERTRATTAPGLVPAPKFLSQQNQDRNKTEKQIAEDKMLFGDESTRMFETPPIYRKPTIKYSRFGVEDFDFSYYNNTNFSGLETNIPNSYMNPLLQLYRFTPQLRNVALMHTALYCTKEDCVICQMGFLFDMLEKAGGLNCQATNFLKTLSANPSAARHGVLEDEGPNQVPYNSMMQALNRFLLDQVIADHKSLNSQENMELPGVITTRAIKSQRCMVCQKETRSNGDVGAIDLLYSPKPVGKPLHTFAATVKQSIQVETTPKGWCDKCRRYQMQSSRKHITNLPDVLTFNATPNISDQANNLPREYWSTPGWVPDKIGFFINQKHLNAWQGADLERLIARNNQQLDLKVYELVGFVVEIKEDERKHMVSVINVGHTEGGDAQNWHIFNDFLVRRISKEEAFDFTPKWKLPSVVCYQLKSDRCHIDNSWREKLDTYILYSDFPYLGYPKREPTVMPLDSQTETPKKGMKIALDAEFVSMRKEVIEVTADGGRNLIRPSRLGLARVSVLRGEGENEGAPFLDDYIATKEPVVDYLTEYSGIYPGDLSPETTTHALVSLKVAYKRLWILLNLGCVFIGHGLLKDFRIINIHVPKDQVIDTVDLYVLRSSQRKLSLRFLAWVILEQQIQTETHDSIEDSRTALKLYRKYLEYQDAGVLETVLDNLYSVGVKSGFKVPQLEDSGVVATAVPGRLRGEDSGMIRSETATPQPRGE